MSLNEGFSETYIFDVWDTTVKVIINFTKGMYTIYAPNGKILVRNEKMTLRELRNLKSKIKKYMDGKSGGIYPYSSFKGFRIA